MSEVLVHPIIVCGERGDKLRLSAEFRSELGKNYFVNFAVPKTQQSSLTSLADPFVLAFLFLMMREGRSVHVRGALSRSLLQNLEEYMAIWQMWRPGIYHSVAITAEQEVEIPHAAEKKSILAFSGGLDSCCIARRHAKKLAGRRSRNLTAGLFVHGFDIPLSNPDSFERARKKNEILTQSLGMELLTLATDYRALPVDWNDSHGAALAACLSLFAGQFESGLIAASAPYDLPVTQAGSTPVADPFLSSEHFKIIHDGAELPRIDRAKFLLDWPEGLKNVRVCWKGKIPDENCCHCDKCIRTLLEFRVLGVKPEAFATDVTDEQIRQLGNLNFTARAPLQRIVRMAKDAGFGNESWVTALEESVGSTTQKAESAAAFVWQRFTSKEIEIPDDLSSDADILWIEGKSRSSQTPEFQNSSTITPHILAPLVQFPLAVRMKNSWAEKHEKLLKQVTYPFDIYWLGMLSGAQIRVHVLPEHNCPPRIDYKIKEWLPFDEISGAQNKITALQSFFHALHNSGAVR